MLLPPWSVVMSTLCGIPASWLLKWMTTGLLAFSVSVFCTKAMPLASRLALAPPPPLGGAAGLAVVGGAPVVAGDLTGVVVGAAAGPGSPPPVPLIVTVPVMFGWTSQW